MLAQPLLPVWVPRERPGAPNPNLSQSLLCSVSDQPKMTQNSARVKHRAGNFDAAYVLVADSDVPLQLVTGNCVHQTALRPPGCWVQKDAD